MLTFAEPFCCVETSDSDGSCRLVKGEVKSLHHFLVIRVCTETELCLYDLAPGK